MIANHRSIEEIPDKGSVEIVAYSGSQRAIFLRRAVQRPKTGHSGSTTQWVGNFTSAQVGKITSALTALPDFNSTTTLSATPSGPLHSSQSRSWWGHSPHLPTGLPVLRSFPICRHAIATTPVELGASFTFPSNSGLPRITAGSASTSPFSRPAQRSLHVTACLLAELLKSPLHWKLQSLRYLHDCSNHYRSER